MTITTREAVLFIATLSVALFGGSGVLLKPKVTEWQQLRQQQINVRDPVVGFIFNSSGLMANLTLEGTRFTRIVR